ncbi:MAG: hypothetical protein R3321_12735, partial [Nitrososphaeraceae archaeon]|nr:hypothetical protein [Nitrososphaeraceae archaeon]
GKALLIPLFIFVFSGYTLFRYYSFRAKEIAAGEILVEAKYIDRVLKKGKYYFLEFEGNKVPIKKEKLKEGELNDFVLLLKTYHRNKVFEIKIKGT